MDITGRACQRMCEIQNFSYCPYVGLKLGHRPWHATFNRIPLLHELAQTDFAGWIIYLDADAYPFDLAFDLRGYLQRNSGFALIGAPCQPTQPLPNGGILLLNFADRRTREIIGAWMRKLYVIFPGGALPDAAEWPDRVENDQSMLHYTLVERNDIGQLLKLEPLTLMGAPDSNLLRQVMRQFGDLNARCIDAEQGVRRALDMARTVKHG